MTEDVPLMLQSTNITTPLGIVQISGSDRHLESVQFVEETSPYCSMSANGFIAAIADQFMRYFEGTLKNFNFKEIPTGTAFQQDVWKLLYHIPYGHTSSYVAIAKKLGDVKKTRAVGAAIGANPLLILIPCHRVISSDGKLTGYAGGTYRKQWLLQHEKRMLTGQQLLF